MFTPESPHALMGFYFYPRGGSAQVARYLSRALVGGRWEPTIFAGSLGTETDNSFAGCFFSGLCTRSLDYTAARQAWTEGRDPMDLAVPLHASYEDKPGVPDRMFLRLDDDAFARQVASWSAFLSDGCPESPSVLHLHHLTPIHEAAHSLWPEVPVITHIHGTELKMLAAIRNGDMPLELSGVRADAWVERFRRWAALSARLVVVSDMDHQLALDLLSVGPDRLLTIPNGVDTEVFAPSRRCPDERLRLWRRWLVDEPRGWRPNGAEGSISYSTNDLSAFTGDDGQPVPVVLFAGRFLAFKRLQLLIEAHHLLRTTTDHRSVLVIIGGFPGEWEGEHPFDTVCRLGAQGVFFVGWRDHRDLAQTLACSDVFAAPSVDEPFGLVYLEAMSAGLPAIATATGGPLSFINVGPGGPTGWLVPPDDVTATANAIAEAVSDPAERAARGRRSARFVRERYSWASAAAEFADLYGSVVDGQSRPLLNGVA